MFLLARTGRAVAPIIALVTGLALGSCDDEPPAPPFPFDASAADPDAFIAMPGPPPTGGPGDGGGGDGGDGGSFDGGTPRCTVTLADDLVDDPIATGAGFDVASLTPDPTSPNFAVGFAYENRALEPHNNVYLRGVFGNGSLGPVNPLVLVNSEIVTTQPIVANPALIAVRTDTGQQNGDLIVVWDQAFPATSGTTGVQRDLVFVHVDGTLTEGAQPELATITDDLDESLPRGAALPALDGRVVFSMSDRINPPKMGAILIDANAASPSPINVAPLLDLVGAPVIASVADATVAAFLTGAGPVVSAQLTTTTISGTQPVITGTSNGAVAIAGDQNSSALVVEGVSGGRPTLRLVALDTEGAALTSPKEITPSPISATTPGIAYMGSSRLVVYRGSVGGVFSIRAAFLDASGNVLSDQSIAPAAATGGVRVAALSDTTALVAFDGPATGGTTLSPGYRVRAALLDCTP